MITTTPSTKTSEDRSSLQRGPENALELQCPSCVTSLRSSESYPQPTCPTCRFDLLEVEGILRALTPEREAHFRQFIRDYETVREKEGRGSSSADYYLRLPFEDITGHNRWQWEIRGRTFRYLERRVLPKIEAVYPQGFDFLDIGAGNCWLSYRLALRGHRPVAVDLLDNHADGLGAAKHYFDRLPRSFPRFQAEMDRLPFAGAQFDVVIFNAAFHYSVDYEQTLREALRCLRRPGYLIIADSPLYTRDESGQAMLQAKRASFLQRYGFPSDSIASREYLTWDVLREMTHETGLQWEVGRPWYGVTWALRPVKALLLRRREPSRFYLLWARVEG